MRPCDTLSAEQWRKEIGVSMAESVCRSPMISDASITVKSHQDSWKLFWRQTETPSSGSCCLNRGTVHLGILPRDAISFIYAINCLLWAIRVGFGTQNILMTSGKGLQLGMRSIYQEGQVGRDQGGKLQATRLGSKSCRATASHTFKSLSCSQTLKGCFSLTKFDWMYLSPFSSLPISACTKVLKTVWSLTGITVPAKAPANIYQHNVSFWWIWGCEEIGLLLKCSYVCVATATLPA